MTTLRGIPKVGKRYMELFARFPIRPLRDEEQYDAASSVLDELAVRDEGSLSPDEQDYLDALTMLVEAYDREHHRVDTSGVAPVDLLRFLMEQQDMSPSDLSRLLGSKAAASFLLNGRRAPSSAQCFTLARHFGVDPGLFLVEPRNRPPGARGKQNRRATGRN